MDATTTHAAEQTQTPDVVKVALVSSAGSEVEKSVLVVQQQPSSTPQMDFKNAKGLPVNAQGQREWNSGLFDCCADGGTCLKAYCCPCCLYSLNKRRLVSLQTTGVPLAEKNLTCNGDAFIYAALASCSLCWVLESSQRGEVRQRYNISGSAFGDFLSTWALQVCCGGTAVCTQTQVSRELAEEENAYERAQGHSHQA